MKSKEKTDPSSPLSDVVNLVRCDPSIMANLLKIYNSAHFGLVGKIDSIHHSISLLGVNRIVELVLTYGLSQSLQQALAGYQLAKGELWKHSVASAMLAKSLAEQRQLENPVTIFTVALLRDIGNVILHDYVADKVFRQSSRRPTAVQSVLNRSDTFSRLTFAINAYRILPTGARYTANSSSPSTASN